MPIKATWDDLELVVRGLSQRDDGPPVRGVFKIENDRSLEALQACISSSETDTRLELLGFEDPNTLKVGQAVEIQLAPRLGFGILVKSLDSLLNAQFARIKEPTNFLLLDDLLSSKAVVDENHVLTRYRVVLSFIQTLKRAAAFLDQDEQLLVFIKEGKFEIPINYDEADLRGLRLSDVQAVASILPKGTHETQCVSILADAVVEMTKHLPTYSRFQYLLTHIADLRKRYEEGYNLFASGFSFEKVRDQIESTRIEYAGKIHKVFSDIQNQLLSIPVATVIVATQMKSADKVGYEYWVNSAVLVGCWVFAVLMVFLLYNQWHTLDVIGTEIQRQKRQLQKEYASVASTFADTFTYLRRRSTTQYCLLIAVGGIVGVGLFLAHFVFIKLTTPAHDWLIQQWPLLSRFL